MHRFWDCIVGCVMIAISVVFGGIVAVTFAFPVEVTLANIIPRGRLDGRIVFAALAVVIFLCLQAAGFYDYYRRRKINYATKAGLFHLVPRAIQRLRTGYEMAGIGDDATGRPIGVQNPIYAGRRSVTGLLLTATSAGMFCFCMTSKGIWTLVGTALGLIGTVAGLVLLAQAALAYAGFIRRKQ